MKRTLALLALATALGAGPAAAQKINLNGVTAGDQNMVDYVNTFLAPGSAEPKGPTSRSALRSSLIGAASESPQRR